MLPRSMTRWTLAFLLWASASHQAVAAPLGFQATLSVEFGLVSFTVPLSPSPTIPGSGVADVAPNGSFAVPAGAVAGVATLPILGTATTAIVLSASLPAGTLSLQGGTLPLQGSLRVCAFSDCGFIVVPLGQLGTAATVVTNIPGIGSNQTVRGVPWGLTATILNTAIFFEGFAHGPASATSTAVAPGGTLQLVSATLIRPGNEGGPETPYTAVARLTFDFVPEPASALLLGLGVVALAARGAKRRA
jgi:hypothetical protein